MTNDFTILPISALADEAIKRYVAHEEQWLEDTIKSILSAEEQEEFSTLLTTLREDVDNKESVNAVKTFMEQKEITLVKMPAAKTGRLGWRPLETVVFHKRKIIGRLSFSPGEHE